MGGTIAGRKQPQNQCEAYLGSVETMETANVATALHDIQDSYVHDYKYWDGGYTRWHIPGITHIWNDLSYNDQPEAASEAYLRSLGNALNPAAFMAPAPSGCN